MGFLFNGMRKPRGFNHQYIYVDERKEKLQKREEEIKREMGLIPKKEFSPDDIRGKIFEQTKHLKRHKSKKPMSFVFIIVAIIALLLLWNYLSNNTISLPF